jgi:hypothetical protein
MYILNSYEIKEEYCMKKIALVATVIFGLMFSGCGIGQVWGMHHQQNLMSMNYIQVK